MPHPGQSKCIELLKYIGIGMLLATYASLPATSHGDQSSIEISNPNLMGINIASPLDWEEDRLYADVIRMSRDFKAGADPNSRNLAAVDEEGWPVADFSFYVWAGIGKMHGTYTLSFKGQARVLANPGGNIPLSYDAASNTSSGKIRYTNSSPGALALIFTGTKRNNASASESGVTAIRLMRPLAPGASTSYPQTTLFNEPIKAIISKFSVIRFMDFLATNANQQKTWHERPLPSAPSFQRKVRLSGYGWQGSGGALEHAILLANETGKDAWINIPVLADDDFVLKVARMIAFGSDGINPYVSRQKNPVYPPLNPDLRVYVEYSNELWNSAGAFTQFHDNCQAASDELVAAAGNTPLNWDGIWNSVAYHQNGGNNSSWKWSMCSRRSAKRTVEISTIFRKVFGDAAMMTRVRPVMMSQLTYSSGMLFEETKMLFNYYNHMAGDFAGAPPAHPPSYYIYGAGGSGYYNPAKPLSNITSVDLLFNDAEMQAAGFAPELQADAHYTAALGVKRIAYEGGPNLE
ncbi:MAG: hypothetical protein OEV35_07410, partial [Gallionellaceae bacterium]|nr:hypothetical protein [Gallionellaceae bacterium]